MFATFFLALGLFSVFKKKKKSFSFYFSLSNTKYFWFNIYVIGYLRELWLRKEMSLREMPISLGDSEHGVIWLSGGWLGYAEAWRSHFLFLEVKHEWRDVCGPRGLSPAVWVTLTSLLALPRSFAQCRENRNYSSQNPFLCEVQDQSSSVRDILWDAGGVADDKTLFFGSRCIQTHKCMWISFSWRILRNLSLGVPGQALRL